MAYLVFSCSLDPESHGLILSRRVTDLLRDKGVEADLVDLRDMDLPACDGDTCYDDPNVGRLSARIQGAQGALIATPIYNYQASATAKNLIELTGAVWTKKVVGFLCAAGGRASYMSIMGLANSLMLNFRSVIIPRFVYAEDDAFEGGAIADPVVEERLDELAATLVLFSEALQEYSSPETE